MASTWSVGSIVAEKYRVERVLGEGGMGVVLAATHLELEELVALKVLHGFGAKSEEVVARFLREGKAAARIKSEHAVKVRDIGRLSDGAPFMVMELLEGEDLGNIADRGGVPVATAVGWILQACDALAEAHAAGVIHRDLKPANLFLAKRRNGETLVKVLDFGISKLSTDAPDGRRTSTGAVFGSPMYMSPEQLHSTADVDERTDVWSLATVLFELLAGRPAFLADSLPLVHVAILHGPTPNILARRPGVPSDLADVLRAALAKNRDDRTPSIAAFAQQLLPFAGGAHRAVHHEPASTNAGQPNAFVTGSVPAGSSRATSAQAAPPIADTQATFTGFARPEHKRVRGFVLALSFCGLLLVAGGGLILRTLARQSARTSSSSTPSVATVAIADPVASTAPPVPSGDVGGAGVAAKPTDDQSDASAAAATAVSAVPPPPLPPRTAALATPKPKASASARVLPDDRR